MKEFSIRLFSLFLLLTLNTYIFSQTILIDIPEFPNENIILAQHHGDAIYIKMELNSNESGKVVFYNDSLFSGIYYILLPDTSSYEFLYDSDFSGKISSEIKNGQLYILDAPLPTSLYSDYSKELTKLSENINITPDSLINIYISKDKGSLLSKFLIAHKNITVPKNINANYSALEPSQSLWKNKLLYYQKHYLDNVDLKDNRLINTPIYTIKINEYLDKIVSQKPKGITAAIDNIIMKIDGNYISEEFTLNYLLDKYSSRKKNATHEYAYLHIIKSHFLESKSPWITDKQTNNLFVDFNRLYPSSLYQKAPNISGLSIKGKKTNLYDLNNSGFTILYFYDYDCRICSRISPQIKHLGLVYEYLNINTFAVCLGDDMKQWTSYIKKNHLDNWTNIIEKENTDIIGRDYNLSFTPTIFLLDSDKSIIGKNLNTKQLEDILLKEAIKANK